MTRHHFPVGPLFEAVATAVRARELPHRGETTAEQREIDQLWQFAVGVSTRTYDRWRRGEAASVRSTTVDHVCTKLGLSPFHLYPELWGDVDPEPGQWRDVTAAMEADDPCRFVTGDRYCTRHIRHSGPHNRAGVAAEVAA